ncbi:hypothetical protein Dimus_034092 [Dionaea muscipula]
MEERKPVTAAWKESQCSLHGRTPATMHAAARRQELPWSSHTAARQREMIRCSPESSGARQSRLLAGKLEPSLPMLNEGGAAMLLALGARRHTLLLAGGLQCSPVMDGRRRRLPAGRHRVQLAAHPWRSSLLANIVLSCSLTEKLSAARHASSAARQRGRCLLADLSEEKRKLQAP